MAKNTEKRRESAQGKMPFRKNKEIVCIQKYKETQNSVETIDMQGYGYIEENRKMDTKGNNSKESPVKAGI